MEVQHPCPECWVIDFEITQTVTVGSELTLPDNRRYKVTSIHGVKFEELKTRVLLHMDCIGGFIPDEWARKALDTIRDGLRERSR